jgi:hypothetical protein
MNTSSDDMRRALAEDRSFTGSAVLVFVLYWLLWLPGLVTNIMYLNEARRVKRITGRSPSGMGCLWVLLIFAIAPLIGACMLLGPAFLSGLAGNPT